MIEETKLDDGWVVHDGGPCPVGPNESIRTKQPYFEDATIECVAHLYKWEAMAGVPYLHVKKFDGEIYNLYMDDKYRDFSKPNNAGATPE